MVIYRGSRYYLTNIRVVSEHGFASKRVKELRLENLVTARTEQAFSSRIHGIGRVYFEPRVGQRLVFRRVKDPDEVKQKALDARELSPGSLH